MRLGTAAVRCALLTALATVAALGFAGVACATRAPYTASIAVGPGQKLLVTAGARDVVRTSVRPGPARLGCSQVQQTFRVGTAKAPAGSVSVTVRTLPSGSRMVFAELSAPKSSVPIVLSVSSEATSAAFNDLGLRPDLTYDSVTGVDRTSGPIGWVEFRTNGSPTGYALVSKSYEFTNLTKVYSKTKSSSVRRLLAETRPVGLSRRADGGTNLALFMSARKSVCQRYVLLTERAITDTATAQYSIGHVTSAEWAWMDPQGSYGKAPYSIEPETKYGYVRDLVHARAAATVSAYRATASPLFEDLLTNDLYTLSLTRSADGLWRTNYTSQWVKAESGITAPFVDTRNNEQIALQSMAIADALATHGVTAAASARGWAPSYATFLYGRARAGAVARTAHGAFFGDYYDSRGTLRVHTSLNHALGEMNYLMTLYGQLPNPVYLAMAGQIKGALDDTGAGWIRPNSDLWYQRNLNRHFTGLDYKWVTYWDLLNTQHLFQSVLTLDDPVVAQLVAAKSKYLGITPSSARSSSSRFGPMPPASLQDSAELP